MPGSSAPIDRGPALLADPAALWIVEQGSADVFLVEVRDGAPAGARHHLLRVTDGGALCGTSARPDGLALLVVASPDARLRQTTRDELSAAPGQDPATVAGWIDGWITALSRAVAGDALPRVFGGLEPGGEIAVTADASRVLLPRTGVVWAHLVEGSAHFLGDERWPIGAEPVPVAASAWIVAAPNTRVRVADTVSRLGLPGFWEAFDRFVAALVDAAVRSVERARVREAERLRRRAAMEQASLDLAFRRLASAGRASVITDETDADPWLAACRVVGRAMGMALDSETPPATVRLKDPVAAVALALGVRSRVVALKGAWWRQDVGPLVARRESDGAPVALLPVSARRYDLYDPAAGVRTRVTESVAATVEPLAWCLYRPFPPRPLGAMDLVRFGLQGARRDLSTIALMGMATGLLGLLVPVVTGVVFDTVIPGADRRQLLVVTLVLMAGAASGAAFQLVQNFAMQRIESRMDASLQAAVWDRLLALPVPFFRDYSSGDLAMRSLSISTMRRVLTGSVVSSVLTGIFSLFSFAVLFYYSGRLALLATGLIAVMALVTTALGYLDLRYQRDVASASGRLSGMLLQLVNGISKLRVSATENRAFAVWADEFSRRQQATRKARLVNVALSVFMATMPILAMAVIFWATARLAGQGTGAALTTGAFLAFNAAFAQFQSAVLGLSGAAVALLGIVPLYERARPILQAVPERARAAGDPGELAGHIEVAHVNFRYRPDAPLVLRDVSMRLPAGRFVAIVGASGSGKSTLFRMLMGFEKPESGAIYFDHQDQAHLNVEALRRQIGVVLQSGRLLSDSMFRNIVGASNLTLDDAWAAATMAGLDADIRAMPMGMHTLIAEGGGGLSGGQRQRVMIARAIVRRPRILLFDEATSALDNETQSIVTRSLASLQATRVVIAHRLSTIMHADYIYVMDKGAVVQEGTYQDLIAREGPFADLARRQTA